MIEEVDFETYLYVSRNKFEISLFDKVESKNLYKNESKIKNNLDNISFLDLSKFLDENIFKIEKLIGKFIKNIFLIVEYNNNLDVNICIKKKNYDNLLSKKNLEYALIDVRDLFMENYKKQTIMHIIINNYLIDGKYHSSFVNNLKCDYLCLEVSFISLSSEFIYKFEKILEKYQITISQTLSGNYIKHFFNEKNIDICDMAQKITHGCNENEVAIIPKNKENKGFFEKFFQLFS